MVILRKLVNAMMRRVNKKVLHRELRQLKRSRNDFIEASL
jgi:hypothetical protein